MRRKEAIRKVMNNRIRLKEIKQSNNDMIEMDILEILELCIENKILIENFSIVESDIR